MVKECTLDIPVSEAVLTLLQDRGYVSMKRLGGSVIFTFTCDLLSLKGMVGDTILYITHRKEDGQMAMEFITSFLETVPGSDR